MSDGWGGITPFAGAHPDARVEGATGHATLTVVIVFDDIPGRHAVADTLTFDATPDEFDRVWEQMRVAMHDRAASPLRPCGHPGPWHTGSGE